jgi:hypothetical protein
MCVLEIADQVRNRIIEPNPLLTSQTSFYQFSLSTSRNKSQNTYNSNEKIKTLN